MSRRSTQLAQDNHLLPVIREQSQAPHVGSPHPIVHYNSTFPFTESRFGMGLVMKEQIEFVRLKFNLSPHNT